MPCSYFLPGVLLLASSTRRASGFAVRRPVPVAGDPRRLCRNSVSTLFLANEPPLLLQSDATQFGRGEMHLSAMLQEGDVVAYQTGRWLVDGVWVGDADDGEQGQPGIAFACVDTVQIVWTHNCEHGVIRGIALQGVGKDDSDHRSVVDACVVSDPVQFVEFGPEQLLAKIPVQWDGTDQNDSTVGTFGIPIAPSQLLSLESNDDATTV